MQQEGLSNVQLMQASATELPIRDSSFDLIVLNRVLEWVGQWDTSASPDAIQLRFLQKLHRALKPEGILLVGIENRISYNFCRRKRSFRSAPHRPDAALAGKSGAAAQQTSSPSQRTQRQTSISHIHLKRTWLSLNPSPADSDIDPPRRLTFQKMRIAREFKVLFHVSLVIWWTLHEGIIAVVLSFVLRGRQFSLDNR
jgi:SAM-dependent methyltransferase